MVGVLNGANQAVQMRHNFLCRNAPLFQRLREMLGGFRMTEFFFGLPSEALNVHTENRGTRFNLMITNDSFGGLLVVWPGYATYRWHPSGLNREAASLVRLHGVENEVDEKFILEFLEQRIKGIARKYLDGRVVTRGHLFSDPVPGHESEQCPHCSNESSTTLRIENDHHYLPYYNLICTAEGCGITTPFRYVREVYESPTKDGEPIPAPFEPTRRLEV